MPDWNLDLIVERLGVVVGMVELIWEKGGLIRRMTGNVTAEELDSSAKELQSDERIDRLHYIIHDFSGANEIVVSQDDIEFMAVRASFALLKNPWVRIAFVGNHPVVQALINAFNDLGESSHRCHRFDTLAEGRAFAST